MTLTLHRITNPRAFFIPDLQSFMLKTLSTLPTAPDAHAALIEMVDLVPMDFVGLFVVREGDRYVGMAFAENNRSAITPGCLVLHFYNEGSAAARKLLIQTVIEFARLGGMLKIRGFDINHKPEAFARLFRDAGPAKPLGQCFEFDVSRA